MIKMNRLILNRIYFDTSSEDVVIFLTILLWSCGYIILITCVIISPSLKCAGYLNKVGIFLNLACKENSCKLVCHSAQEFFSGRGTERKKDTHHPILYNISKGYDVLSRNYRRKHVILNYNSTFTLYVLSIY